MTWLVPYAMFAIVVAYLYTKYYMATFSYEWEYHGVNTPQLRRRMAVVVFLVALVIAPFILMNKIYDMVQY